MNEASYVDFCEDDIVAVDDSLEQFTSREVLENLVNIRERHEATGIIPNCHIFPWIEPLKYRESSFCQIRAKWPSRFFNRPHFVGMLNTLGNIVG